MSTSALGPGVISPTSATVTSGGRTSFTITPASGQQIASVMGCAGTLSGTTYTTGAVSSACTVAARFSAVAGDQNWVGVVQSSDKATLWGFDFVEEFDGLAVWNMSSLERVGNQYVTANADRMPKLENGDPSPWSFFSLWSHEPSTHAWIGGTTGGRQVWRGSKSASIDLGETGRGPSRLGLYFGDAGYRNFRLFYMVWIPKNMFPTSCVSADGGCDPGQLGVYTEGQPYTYFASWKFNTFNVECNGVSCPPPRGPGYGAHSAVPQIKQHNYAPIGLLLQNQNYGPEQAYASDMRTTLNDFMGQWWGVEFHIRNNSDDTAYTMDMWTYDQAGNSQHVMQGQTFPLNAAAHGGRWDQFFFGGNNANSWLWGPTMASHYYIDDFIIDAGDKVDEMGRNVGPIGPRYFDAIRAR